MRKNLFYLLGIPLIWLLVAFVSAQPIADKVVVLAVAPSAWLILFNDPLSLATSQMILGGLPVMVLVGLTLSKLNVKLKQLTICSVISTLGIWAILLVMVSKSTAIKVPGAPFIWLLCCFNLSLCLLPFWAILVKFLYKNNPERL